MRPGEHPLDWIDDELASLDAQGLLRGLITVKDIQKKLKYPNAAKDSHGPGDGIRLPSVALTKVEA